MFSKQLWLFFLPGTLLWLIDLQAYKILGSRWGFPRLPQVAIVMSIMILNVYDATVDVRILQQYTCYRFFLSFVPFVEIKDRYWSSAAWTEYWKKRLIGPVHSFWKLHYHLAKLLSSSNTWWYCGISTAEDWNSITYRKVSLSDCILSNTH